MDEEHLIAKTKEVLIKRLQPSKIFLFGSRAKKTHSKNSDFDFAVDCKKPDLRLQRQVQEQIEEFSGLFSVDIVYFSSIDEHFKKIIYKSGTIIYER